MTETVSPYWGNRCFRTSASTASAVARAVVDSVAEGVIPKDKAEEFVIVCGVFIHWEAADDTKIYQYNYDATKLAIKGAMRGEPKMDEIIAKKATAHPFEK